jgi:hypothetical protein
MSLSLIQLIIIYRKQTYKTYIFAEEIFILGACPYKTEGHEVIIFKETMLICVFFKYSYKEQ